MLFIILILSLRATLGGHLKEANLKEIAKTQHLDSFLLAHFKKLPTEQCYKDLSVETKILLYYMVVENPSAEDVKKSIDYYKYLQTKKMSEDMRGDADKMGIDMDAINKMIESGELNT
ncbi:unnamed protein product [marine sediment metagenome]|uniref:Uncharacterized protein n=1 Tax=marine sediment metagenome TaxID=412755 RepID=X1RHI4_9ZZZZ